jgi:NADPH-dependent 2,4-dienoyl-CoA reductase/sulfur reductase-like enzyme/rhodanese-related sulfurtransferase
MKVVVVGGVAGGASAAARIRRLDEQAEIVVLERDDYVSFANCGLPYHIGGEIRERSALLLQTPESLKADLNLDVRTGHEVTEIDRSARRVSVVERRTGRSYSESYDKLVLAQGAAPIRPGIPGVDHPRVYVLRNIPDMDAIKAAVDGGARSAVVVGGGYIGIEIAEALRHRELAVTLVEMIDQVMPPLDHEMARDLQYHIEAHGVVLHLGTAATAVREEHGRPVVELRNGLRVPGDIVVMAAGVMPESTLARRAGLELGSRQGIRVNPYMQTSDPDIYAVGDAVETTDRVSGLPVLVPLAGPANRQGRIAADHMCGRPSRYRGTLGTAIVKVFEMSGGGTGASEKALRALRRPYRKVYLHPSGHASYYPGTAPMQLKLLFAPEDGRALGAQVVGYDGVDKRLDIFATAIAAGMTVFDLEHLELSYAPPYGSAKDPVNMAGFIAANVLRGDLNLWYAEDYPQETRDGIIIDVRSAVEYENWHIPGAVHIPLRRLRQRHEEIPRQARVFLYCRVGFRSYLAYRMLNQLGFEQVSTLAGGSKTFMSYHRTELSDGRPGVSFVAYAEEELARTPEGLQHA